MNASRWSALILAAAVASAMPACGDGKAPPGGVTSPSTTAPAASASPAPATNPVTWTSDPVTVKRDIAVPPVPRCVQIRSAAHPQEGFDRIVFDFEGPLPGYEVRYVDQVIGDASGEVIPMPGRRYLQITFRPAQGHDDQGHAVSGRKDLNYPMLKGYVVAGDFEAVFTVALGLDDTVGFHVGELPGRIYFDVAA